MKGHKNEAGMQKLKIMTLHINGSHTAKNHYVIAALGFANKRHQGWQNEVVNGGVG